MKGYICALFVLCIINFGCKNSPRSGENFDPKSICEHVEDGMCNPKIDSTLRTLYPNVFERPDEHTLLLHLKSGKTETWADIERHGEYTTIYRAVNYLQSINLIVVYIMYNEASDYMLIDGDNGNITHAIGLPVVSPDKNNIACINMDLAARYSPNGIQIWNRDGKKLRKFFQHFTRDWGPKSLTWKSSDEISLERVTVDQTGFTEIPATALDIKLINNLWTISDH